MKKYIFLLGFSFFIGLGLWETQVFAAEAQADLATADGEAVGKASFDENEAGVRVQLEAWGLSKGMHGIHVHAAGKCEGPDFKSAEGHFNPEGKKHGAKNPEGKHEGDLPNLEVGEDGKAKTEFELEGAKLFEGPNALLKEGGTALVIHAGPDDEMTDPAGNSGDRIACGVIKKSTV